MTYQEPEPLTRDEATRRLRSGDSYVICETLVSVALYEPDLVWAQEQCLHFLQNGPLPTSQLAATCLGHLARIHGELDLERVVPLLSSRIDDPAMRDYVDSALDDMAMFIDGFVDFREPRPGNEPFLLDIGDFRELDHGDPDGVSIHDAIGLLPVDLREHVAAYLEAGTVLAAMGRVGDVLDPAAGQVAELAVATDGVWRWHMDLPYYIRRYGVALPDEFVEHVDKNKFRPPHLDQATIERLIKDLAKGF